MEKRVLVPERIWTIENFFSPEECAAFIQQSEDIGFEAASVGTKTGPSMLPEVRNNSRVILDDPELAQRMWERVEPFVPSPLFKWLAVGLNERWRFYRYNASQTFKPHRDGSVKRENGEKSQVTFMVYLNDEFEGGATRFELMDGTEINVEPRTGMALLFLHTLLHEGAPVLSGRKYVLRSDVMYGVEE